MVKVHQINPVARAVGVIGVVAVLATATTFAALSSTATLTNFTVNSGTAGLVVDGDMDNTFAKSEAGAGFTGVVPSATQWSTSDRFQLRNTGTLALDIYAQITGESGLPAGVS